MPNVAPFSETLPYPEIMGLLAARLTSGEALPLATWFELVAQTSLHPAFNVSSHQNSETCWWSALYHAINDQDLEALAKRLREPEAALRFRSDSADDQACQREVVSRALCLATNHPSVRHPQVDTTSMASMARHEIIVGMLLAAGATPVLEDISFTLGAGCQFKVNERLFDRVMDALEQRLGPCSTWETAARCHTHRWYEDMSMLWLWAGLVDSPAWGRLGETSAQVQRRVQRLTDMDPHAFDAPYQAVPSFWTTFIGPRHLDPTSWPRTRWALPVLLERGLLGPLPLDPETLRRIFSQPFKDMIEPTLTFLMAQEALDPSSRTLILHSMCAAELMSGDDGHDLLATLDAMAQQGIDLHGVDAAGHHALHILAAHSARLNVAQWLIERGIDPQATNRAGQTPLDVLMASPTLSERRELRTLLESLALQRASSALSLSHASAKPRL